MRRLSRTKSRYISPRPETAHLPSHTASDSVGMLRECQSATIPSLSRNVNSRRIGEFCTPSLSATPLFPRDSGREDSGREAAAILTLRPTKSAP